MKEFTIKIPENCFELTQDEIRAIHAMAFYFSVLPVEGLTARAMTVIDKLEEKTRNLETKEIRKNFRFWSDD